MIAVRQIEVEPAVFAAIWKNHRMGELTENDILKRILGVDIQASTEKREEKIRWIDDVISGINALGGRGYYAEIYNSVREIRARNGRSIPPSFEAIVRREIENHSSDSQAYKHTRDLFHAPKGLGAGYWILR